MSIQSEINRIGSAKTAISTAIAGKGVAVPSGTKLDGMAALIESIEAGSGGVASEGANVTLLGSGTFTGDGKNTFEITHGLGVTPKFILTSMGIAAKAYTIYLMATVYMGDGLIQYAAAYYSATTTEIQIVNYGTNYSADDWNNETATIVSPSYNVYYRSNTKYTWRAYG